ncbi:mandelate racemase/muconate lactonizing enzyme family protein [Amycolatopsis magusensis]|uniref:mandelate racemase/muconate lactonizing enzyme family protein n=1 Tax=Amycolatopsis magusensis TaxID=882444 RepID=UPI0024A9DAD8|nr:enolase C-terminal domain-like protein [Amycolatopsis magusensis]MDI5980634.1 enolase C-terminal domain-like protein [Amycolatopsis magusensis]
MSVLTARIAAVHTLPVSLPAHPALVVRGANGSHERSDFLLVRVVTTEGVEGFGEVSATPLWSGEDAASAEHFVRNVLTTALLGRKLAPPGSLEAIMDRVLAANPFTKAGVSTALWDAYARTLGTPLVTALGGPYRDEVPIKLSLSGDGEVLEKAHSAAVAAGFTSFKVKVGMGIDGDLTRVARVRELAGLGAFIGVDANGGWSRAEAREAVRRLTTFAPAFVEQPVQPSDLEGMAAIRTLGVPVIADESVFGADDLARVIRASAADVISVYLGKAGGPARAVLQGRVAETFGLDTVIGSNGELGLGAAAQLHVACALPALSERLPSDIIGAHYYAEDILEKPLDNNGKRVRLTDGHGLGVVPRDDLRRRFR